jgi:pheromone shutdown-related protein TraB
LREEVREIVKEYGSDVNFLNVDDREIIVVGTAHISRQSVDLVREVIENEKPDTVCIELDPQRYKALSEQKRWESLDLKKLIKEKQLSTLIVNILLSSYQKKLGEKLGVMPGTELLEAANAAKENDIPISLCDREIRITLRRAWNSMSFFQKIKLMTGGLAGIFESNELTEEKLQEIRQKDVLSELMAELGKSMPVLKRVLLDERDSYLAQKIIKSEGKKIVAVVGAGHVNGIIAAINEKRNIDLSKIEIIPPASPWIKIIGWGIPAIIVTSIILIGYYKGLAAAGDNSLYWFLANGIPSAIGAIIALGHPITIISVFFAAPFTSLTPLIGAGYVAAFIQAYFNPPLVKEIQQVADDVNKPAMWWRNKLLRVLLVFILSGLGSLLGTYLGAYKIISNLF